ncbi:MAG: HK97 gp10 family phage protein [Acidobacteria bacterium]|nr:HK97 gp10 family phage protein [Acidobacteriota bacterium]
MSMTADFSDFRRRFDKLVRNDAPDDLEKGMFRAGNEILRDAVTVPPGAPKDTGELWRSRMTKRPEGAEKGSGVEAGFNKVYAARWHELTPAEDATINWTRDKGAVSPGRKFLETKFWMFKNKYIRTAVSYLRGRLGGK